MKYTILVLMTSTKEWLALTREQRRAFVAEEMNPIFARYADKVSARFLDAEKNSEVQRRRD